MNRIAFSLLIALSLVAPAQAHWILNGDESTLSFISTKAINVAEVHKFAGLSGVVDGKGQVEISIELASVDTGIEVRDDRMRKMLFEVGKFPSAMMTATLDAEKLNGLATGDSMHATIDGELKLHGEIVVISFDIVVAHTADTRIIVMSEKPLVVNAPLFKLSEGIERLREVAGLPSISTAVPVSFVLVFDRRSR